MRAEDSIFDSDGAEWAGEERPIPTLNRSFVFECLLLTSFHAELIQRMAGSPDASGLTKIAATTSTYGLTLNISECSRCEASACADQA
jgi:hypothetical protein